MQKKKKNPNHLSAPVEAWMSIISSVPMSNSLVHGARQAQRHYTWCQGKLGSILHMYIQVVHNIEVRKDFTGEWYEVWAASALPYWCKDNATLIRDMVLQRDHIATALGAVPWKWGPISLLPISPRGFVQMKTECQVKQNQIRTQVLTTVNFCRCNTQGVWGCHLHLIGNQDWPRPKDKASSVTSILFNAPHVSLARPIHWPQIAHLPTMPSDTVASMPGHASGKIYCTK